MSQFISGSPEDDDQLPSFMEHGSKPLSAQLPQSNQQASAGPSESHLTSRREKTQSPRPDASAHSHSHSHPRGISASPSHSHAHAHAHQHQHQHQRQSTVRSWSTASSSSLGVPGSEQHPPPSRSMSRTSSHEYRETLNAKSRDMEDGSRIINQYKITDVIGRGAYGTVRKAILTEDPSVRFAVKEFGKTRLRKTHRAVNLRKPGRGAGPRARAEFNCNDVENRSEPVKAKDPKKGEEDELKDPLTHIRHEIAILKKLHHPHVVKLFEVLDDPTKDSLYMVFEYCPDGTVIDVKLKESVEPLPEDIARLYFVQILMGIEYLHENEIVHRDIKPDNILLSDDRKTCKIVDFGVSEMFFKPGDDTMQKSAGSPAFMSPELCTAGHQEYHGKADDIWSFGVTLYCMVVGHLPFNKDNFYAMYEAIKNEEPEYPDHLSDDLKDLLHRMLAKDPEERITVSKMRQHPWTQAVEKGILLSREENIEKVVSEITDEDLDCAICKITNIFTFARAISRFKKGGSMQRARKEASRSTSGGSNHDSSWFPPSTSSPDKPGRSNTQAGGVDDDDAAQNPAGDVATIKEETPTPGSREKNSSDDARDSKDRGDRKEEIQELKTAAAQMFESPQMQTFELAQEEPDGNGPLRRNRSGPIATLHNPKPEDMNGPPIITMDSPRSSTPEMFASPIFEDACLPHAFTRRDEPTDECYSKSMSRSHGTSSHNTSSRSDTSTDYTQDTSKPDEAIASQLCNMMLEHQKEHFSCGKEGAQQREGKEGKRRGEVLFGNQESKDPEATRDEPQRAKTLQERAASFGKKKPKPKPKLLPDQPTFKSPVTETIKTPPGAAGVYKQCGHSDDDGDEYEHEGSNRKDENPYFKTHTLRQGKEEEVGEQQDSESEVEKQTVTV